MAKEESIQDILNELQERSGITFTISDSIYDEETTRQKIEDFLSFYKSNDTRNNFYVQFLLGNLSEQELSRNIAKYHISKATPWVVFLLCFEKAYDKSTLSILFHLLSPTTDILVEIDEHQIALLRPLQSSLTEDEIRSMALSLIDTLNMEAMLAVHIGYDACVSSFEDLPNSFWNASCAISIGQQFHLTSSYYGYHSLGLHKLIAAIPKEKAKEFLIEEFPDFSFHMLDNEMQTTIHALFTNGLNIAETARCLYLHRNTLVYRLDKFQKLSHLDLRNFDDAVSCKIGMLLSDALQESDHSIN